MAQFTYKMQRKVLYTNAKNHNNSNKTRFSFAIIHNVPAPLLPTQFD